jgi:hypothetical protein
MAVPAAKPASAGAATRAWPYRSTHRPSNGWNTAEATVYAAETAPAVPYEPVLPAISSTMPSPVIEIGRRATRPAELNATAPGTDRARR